MKLKEKIYRILLNKILEKYNQEFIDLDRIWITGAFERSKVGKKKMQEKRRFYKKYGFFKEQIIINQYNELIDGYTSYLLAKKEKYKEVVVSRIFERDIYYIR